MKKLVVLAILLIACPAIADQWCEWTGTSGTNCQSDAKGFIIINGVNTRTPAIANANGWYKLTTTQPTLGANQVRDAEVWALTDNQMSLTWTVRNMTATEIDERDASAMEIGQYYLWKALLVKGLITQQEAAARLPQELIDAYLARDRLENP